MDSRLRTVLLVVGLSLAAYFLFFRKKDTPQQWTLHEQVDAPSAAARGAQAQHVPIQTQGLTATVDTYSGGLEHLTLTEPQYRNVRTHEPMNISTTWIEQAEQLRSDVSFERGGQNVMPAYLTFTVVRSTPTEVELVAQPAGTDVEVRRVIRARSDYAFAVSTSVINHGAPGRVGHSQSVFHWVRRNEESSGFFRQPWQRSEGMCRHDGHLMREWRDDLGHSGKDGAHNAEFVGLGNLYFLYALVPTGTDHPDCLLRADDRGEPDITGSLLRGFLVWQPLQLDHEASHEYGVVAYFGPKLGRTLTAAAPALHESVNLGFFALIARGLLKLLQFLHGVLGNWGAAIILLTVMVRVALYPILSRSTRSMAVMQRLKPEIDEINAKYKDNTEQRGLATMELYRKHKINPLAGCLPQVAQLPVFWALYATLQTSVELFHSPFVGWLRDLSAPDPFYALPLVLGAVMFGQQKLMPAAMPDPTQQKIMLYFMPLFMTGISLFLPSGLALYMLVNSLLAMGQQRLTKMQVDRMAAAAAATQAIEVRSVTDEAPAPKSNGSKKDGGRRGGRR